VPARVARTEEAADLGRDHELIARPPTERVAEPPLRQAGAVVRRRIEAADAELPRTLDDRLGLLVRDGLVEPTDGRGAEGEQPEHYGTSSAGSRLSRSQVSLVAMWRSVAARARSASPAAIAS